MEVETAGVEFSKIKLCVRRNMPIAKNHEINREKLSNFSMTKVRFATIKCPYKKSLYYLDKYQDQ